MTDPTNGRTDGRRSGTPRRRRLARTAVGLTAVLVLSVAGAGAWFYHRLDTNISTFDPGGVATSRPPAPVPVTPGARLPVNVLVLGSDTREGGNDELGGGDIGVGHSDTAILLHVYADHKHAVGVSIPRDTLVTVPSCKLQNGTWTTPRTNQMFNEAFTVGEFPNGNPACTQNTVEALTGLRIDHTIVVDFRGVAAMTEAINGVDICVPNDVNSHDIRLKKGPQKISGQPAVDFLRARYGFGDNSDIGRMKRQQAFLSSMIKKVQGQGFSLPTLLPLADAATRSLTVDEGLGTAMKLVDFAQSLQNIKLADITFVTTPWRFAGDRVALVHPDVDTLWALLRQDRTLDGRPTGQSDPATAAPAAGPATPETPGGAAPSAVAPATGPAAPATAAASGPAAPATAPIVVVNGTKTAGLAGRAADTLRAKGYQDVTLGASGGGRLTTEITYPAAQQAAVQQLATLFPGARLVAEAGADSVVITLGRDYEPAAVSPAGGATGGPSPSSTIPSTIPTGIADNARTADTDPCANLTFG
ncbi:LCP family protein [Kitasatospora herbaricolor]|uniref:LCP family protein n=1 Tax=Kitasatospora herbaricolor TaxID=68217 RepID=A0ABZ1WDP7_9ACTN|nr:LCP family protein [Kitasatospora herbaricolor]